MRNPIGDSHQFRALRIPVDGLPLRDSEANMRIAVNAARLPQLLRKRDGGGAVPTPRGPG